MSVIACLRQLLFGRAETEIVAIWIGHRKLTQSPRLINRRTVNWRLRTLCRIQAPRAKGYLRFVNNCGVAIVLRTFGAPEGSPKDEVGVMHDVVKDVQFRIQEVTIEPPMLNAQSSEPPDETKMPAGYDPDVSSAETIPPGQSLLFSVPVTHLSKSWHIEIPYRFDLPPGKGPRQPTVGGEPKMILLYSGWDLPEEVQQQLKNR